MYAFSLTETLRSYFSQYGEVVDCVIMKDKTTNQSRGFGFVKFKDPNCVGTVLASRPHTLDGRNVSCFCLLCFFLLQNVLIQTASKIWFKFWLLICRPDSVKVTWWLVLIIYCKML